MQSQLKVGKGVTASISRFRHDILEVGHVAWDPFSLHRQAASLQQLPPNGERMEAAMSIEPTLDSANVGATMPKSS